MEVKGLTEKEAQERLLKFGPNQFPEAPPPSDLKILLLQLKSPLIYILLFAGVVTIFLKDFTDTVVILAAVFINTVLGFYQERKAERALLALKKILTPHAKVIRGGKLKIVEAHLLVPGDLVVLSQGDKVPADGVLVEAVNLSVEEAVLTGESMPVKKVKAQNLKLKTNKNLAFMGTTVSSGRGKMIVTRTGKETEIGKIATTLRGLEEEETPLQKRISSLAFSLALLIGGICGVIFLTGVFLGKSALEMFTTSVAIAVAAIPEGMAVSLTVILAIGMQRILKRKALVRKLLAAETLGSVTVIATDKTGTLTEGKLKVVREECTDKKLAWLASLLVNNQADPLEVALWEWAKENAWQVRDGQEERVDLQKIVEENPRVFEMPFDPEKKYQLVVVEGENKQKLLFLSGAPEVVLAKCKLSDKERKEWMEKIKKWGQEGLRMIGLGYKPLAGDHTVIHRAVWKRGGVDGGEIGDLTFLGLVGFEDPVREGVGEALEACKQAGIKVKIVTGDYAQTAMAVMRRLGMEEKGVIEGEEVEKLSLEELKKRVGEINLFARVTPTQKLKIVEALKENGEVVALVGDGVNDAPALKKADIGIVVGEAQDVAKETADMVLLDSNFKTIVAAIEEGRGIFENMKKVILYLLSDSFSEVLLVLGSLLFGLPLPLTAAQILYINLLTDGFPDLALTVEPKEEGLLKRRPIKRRTSLVNLEGKMLIGLISFVTGVICLLIFALFLKRVDLALSRTITFVALGMDSLFYVFSVRSLRKPIFKTNLFSNPYLLVAVAIGFLLQVLPLYNPFLQRFLLTRPLSLYQWLFVLTTSVFVIILIEGVKYLFLRKKWLDL